MTEDRRTSTLRRDLNSIVRSDNGEFSLTKLIGYCGQGIAGYLLIHHAEYIVDRWDALSILLCALIAPDMVKRIINFKYPSTP